MYVGLWWSYPYMPMPKQWALTQLISSPFAVIRTSNTMKRLYTRFWSVPVWICDHSATRVQDVKQRWQMRRSGAQLSVHYKVSSGVKVRALCRSLEIFHSKLGKPFLHGDHFMHRGALSCWKKVAEVKFQVLHRVAVYIVRNNILVIARNTVNNCVIWTSCEEELWDVKIARYTVANLLNIQYICVHSGLLIKK